MKGSAHKAVAIVGVGAVLPEAHNAATFWKNIMEGRYSVTEVPPERWDPNLYYDPDPKAPDKCYSKIGGWVQKFDWDPLKWKLPIPPKVSDAMDLTQKWAILAAREALLDYGFPKSPLDSERTAVILGNAMGGDTHLLTASRIYFPEFADELLKAPSFSGLPKEVRETILREMHEGIGRRFPGISEDTMPGELSNIIAGRVAALYDFHGPNYTVDAACASAMAAITAAVEGLEENDFDAVITGGIDANMSPSSYVKFCKIGALSATGTRPYADGADGFVMGEGAAVFVLKRLQDAERDGDKIYALFRGLGGSSDGKGKGITAPNPIGQVLCVQRAWESAGLSPATATMVEGHGTSTRVGDVVEVQSLSEVFGGNGLSPGSIALGSVKSNLGHLKGAAGAAGILKTAFALRDKVIPPSLNFHKPNPNIDFSSSPFYVNTELRSWQTNGQDARRAGVSAFGFGGTNFHAVMEEYIPGRIKSHEETRIAVNLDAPSTPNVSAKSPLRGALVIGGESGSEIVARLQEIHQKAEQGQAPPPTVPLESELRATVRLAIDYTDAKELAAKSTKALKAFETHQPAMWRALRAQGIFLGDGPAPKVAFLYTGQGSQYLNMLHLLKDQDTIVADCFAEADRIMTPLLGKPLSDYIFVEDSDEDRMKQANHDLRQTQITQPAVLTTDLAMTRMLAAYGVTPAMVMGHSLGEYGALVAAGALPFDEALKAVSARGTEMARVSVDDNGLMAAVFAPLQEVERIIGEVDGYVVIANINSYSQSVIGGATEAVKRAVAAVEQAGFDARLLPVSHAFHTRIVAPASEPLVRVLGEMNLQPPSIPIVANVTGDFYPMGPGVVPEMLDLLGKQIASPVQFVKGLNTLYEAGARVFVEVGPKKALHGLVEDVLGKHNDVLALFTNHPKIGDAPSLNQALCGLYSAGLGVGEAATETKPRIETATQPVPSEPNGAQHSTTKRWPQSNQAVSTEPPLRSNQPNYFELARVFAEFLERSFELYSDGRGRDRGHQVTCDCCITGASIGLPGTERVFDDGNIERILRGEGFIDVIPTRLRQAMVDKHITRVVKDAEGNGSFETITHANDVIKLAGYKGRFDLAEEFGYPKDRLAALDTVTALAIAAGIDALRDAGIPLVMHYKTTTKGTQLPDRWGLPQEMRDDTGVIFASAFPGYDSYADEMKRYYLDRVRRERLQELKSLREHLVRNNASQTALDEIDRRMQALQADIEKEPYAFDRRFLFRVLSMGHSQFAEYIGARGPNTQVNAACASTTQAVGLANDWIQAGRCQRVIIVSADDITTDSTLDWFGAGFLATGAAATDEAVEEAAIPFDRRRHGMIVGMGSAALVVESPEAVRERGLQPICDVLSTVTANSAFHGTRLDINHICDVMEKLVSQAESQWSVDRHEIAPKTVFVSHETYTPARGGSASAEINALRNVFGPEADKIVIANTKGFTGHAMGTGVEDVVAVKVVETGIVPPVANFKEVDPELGQLNLSSGGAYPIHYALRLGAGFGSQISMTLIRWVPVPDGRRRSPSELGFSYRITDRQAWDKWLNRMTGYAAPELEVDHRTLRVMDQGPEKRVQEQRIVEQPVAKSATATSEPQVSVKSVAVTATVPADSAPSPTKGTEETIAAPAPTVETKPAAAPAQDRVAATVLKIVADQTGYPPDMLDLDLDLEADLGIDTVKQAETFAAIREAYDIPRDDTLKLRDFPTLKHAIQFVYDHRPDLKPTAGPSAPSPAPTAAEVIETGGADPVQEKVLQIVSKQTGYPTDMLDLELDLEADLGIDTVKQAETFAAIRQEYNIPRDETLKLRDFPTLADAIRFVFDRRPDLKAPDVPTEKPSATPTVSSVESTPVIEASSPNDRVKETILELISEKSGYPPDMLDLDLDLEADLGIDTVKQAEMFAAIRQEYDIPRDENLKLRDFPTLAHAIQFVYDRRPDLQTTTESVPPVAEAPAESEVIPGSAQAEVAQAQVDVTENDPVKQKVLHVIAEKTGYPAEMLDLDLDLEADLGIDTVKQAEMFAAIRQEYDIPRDENLKLRDFPTLAHAIQFVYDRRPELQAPSESVPPVPEAFRVSAATPEASGAGTVKTAAKATDNDPVRQTVLEVIAEKTGYPAEMLDPDLDLEADLGIDTVKQAEMFAAIRQKYDISRDENLKLRDFPTLAHAVQFVYDRRSDLNAGAPEKVDVPGDEVPTAIEEKQISQAAPPNPLVGSIEEANTFPRRVPVPCLRPELRFCKPTGIALNAKSRVVVVTDQGGVGKALIKQLNKLGVETLVVDDAPQADELTKRIGRWLTKGPIQGVYWLPTLDYEGDISTLNLDGWRAATHRRVKLLYTTMRALYEQIGGAGTFLVSATRLGGQHGYDEIGALAPLGGAVAGFTKTYKREKPDCLVKVVDFDKSRKTTAFANVLIEETLRDPGAVEIGYKQDKRWTVTLQERAAAGGDTGMELNKDTVFLITGAAGSIVSAITADLAAASGGTFYLLDLTPEPDAGNPDLERFANDKDALKRDIFQRLKASGERATPAMVEKELAKLERSHAALSAIQAVERAGGTAHYHSVNLLDAEAVAKVMQDVRKKSGRIDVLLHAAGLEISHLLPDKTPEEFDLVFDVKSDGWFNLISNIGEMRLGSVVVFSSIAGRFGNGGQTDYSSANDLLCKYISNFRATRPETRGIAIDWTAWGGIGMASRGSIPTVMKQAGIDMLPPEAGIPVVRRELTSGEPNEEVVIAGSLGLMLNEFDQTGGLDLSQDGELAKLLATRGIMSEKVTGMGLYKGLTVETQLDPTKQPFLHDHQINGTPVLPGVMGLEAMVEAAKLLFPKMHAATVENVQFMAPFKFYRNEPRAVTVNALFRQEGEDIIADCRLLGHRKLHGKQQPEVTTHFASSVRLVKEPPKAGKAKVPAATKAKEVKSADIYKLYFHGPAYQVLDNAWQSGKKVIGLFARELPINHEPAELPTLAAPRLIELCFQTAGIWEIGKNERMGLPHGIDKVMIQRTPNDEADGFHAIVKPGSNGDFDAQVVDSDGNVYVTLQGYRTSELPEPIEAEKLQPLKAALK